MPASKHVPLRFLIPLILIGLTILQGAGVLLFGLQRLNQEIAQEKTLELRRVITQLQGSLEYLYRKGDLTRVQEELTALGADPELRIALLIDTEDRIIASTRRQHLDQAASEVIPTLALGDEEHVAQLLRSSSQQTRSTVEDLTPQGCLLGVAPISLQSSGGSLLPTLTGALVICIDLLVPERRARAGFIKSTTPMLVLLVVSVLLVVATMHFLITKRAQNLVSVATSLAAGNYNARTGMTGKDEFSSIGQAFDHMAASVGQARDALQNQQEHLEELVALRTRSLEASNKELESFSYAVAHDLRSPLRAINGYSKILLEDYGQTLDKQAQTYFDRIVAASVHMGDLIDDLLLMARITQQRIDPKDVDLGAMAERLLQVSRLQTPDRHLKCNIQSDMHVSGDESMLYIALMNLLGNAWKFTLKTPSPTIEFGCREVDGETVYYVRDNGCGFDEQYVEKLWLPFHRLHATDEYEGTGIGLATVHKVIARHGGRVWATSQPGEGAEFCFTLGVVRAGNAPA